MKIASSGGARVILEIPNEASWSQQCTCECQARIQRVAEVCSDAQNNVARILDRIARDVGKTTKSYLFAMI